MELMRLGFKRGWVQRESLHRVCKEISALAREENITVIVMICADGTALPLAVIFKGENFQSS